MTCSNLPWLSTWRRDFYLVINGGNVAGCWSYEQCVEQILTASQAPSHHSMLPCCKTISCELLCYENALAAISPSNYIGKKNRVASLHIISAQS